MVTAGYTFDRFYLPDWPRNGHVGAHAPRVARRGGLPGTYSPAGRARCASCCWCPRRRPPASIAKPSGTRSRWSAPGTPIPPRRSGSSVPTSPARSTRSRASCARTVRSGTSARSASSAEPRRHPPTARCSKRVPRSSMAGAWSRSRPPRIPFRSGSARSSAISASIDPAWAEGHGLAVLHESNTTFGSSSVKQAAAPSRLDADRLPAAHLPAARGRSRRRDDRAPAGPDAGADPAREPRGVDAHRSAPPARARPHRRRRRGDDGIGLRCVAPRAVPRRRDHRHGRTRHAVPGARGAAHLAGYAARVLRQLHAGVPPGVRLVHARRDRRVQLSAGGGSRALGRERQQVEQADIPDLVRPRHLQRRPGAGRQRQSGGLRRPGDPQEGRQRPRRQGAARLGQRDRPDWLRTAGGLPARGREQLPAPGDRERCASARVGRAIGARLADHRWRSCSRSAGTCGSWPGRSRSSADVPTWPARPST